MSTKASYVEISESSACERVLSGRVRVSMRSPSEDGKVVLLLDEKPNSTSERAAQALTAQMPPLVSKERSALGCSDCAERRRD